MKPGALVSGSLNPATPAFVRFAFRHEIILQQSSGENESVLGMVAF
jgi:hypothetical protein